MTHNKFVFNVLTKASAGLDNRRALCFTSDGRSLTIYTASLGAWPSVATVCCSLKGIAFTLKQVVIAEIELLVVLVPCSTHFLPEGLRNVALQ